MNKKTVALFLFVFCVISVIAIGIYGKIPDPASTIAVTKIEFIDTSRPEFDFECERTEEDNKIIYIERGNPNYQLTWRITPQDATDQMVTFVVITGGEFVQISTTGMVTFLEEVAVTIRIQSNPQDGRSDVVIIEFLGNPGGGEEPNPF
ncbi:MAG: hypothetical protein WCS53_00770 [Bacilli bacterium]